MKREFLSRKTMSLHEAGHIVTITMLSRPSIFSWRRTSRREFTHTESDDPDIGDWNISNNRNDIIARRVVVALAGGVAEESLSGTNQDEKNSIDSIYISAGAVDFELAHEWLTLQRYDGSQSAILADLVRLYTETRQLLSRPRQRQALATIADRLEVLLEDADRSGQSSLSLPVEDLTRDIILDQAPKFKLKETVKPGQRDACND